MKTFDTIYHSAALVHSVEEESVVKMVDFLKSKKIII